MKLRPEPSNIIQFPRAEAEAVSREVVAILSGKKLPRKPLAVRVQVSDVSSPSRTVRVKTETVKVPRVIVKTVVTRYKITGLHFGKAPR
jgi:hypothetical protein